MTFSTGSIELTALQDSGNTLQDPVSGQPVLVVDGGYVQDLFPSELGITLEAMKNPISTIEHLALKGAGIMFRLLPYRAVRVDCGMLLAARMDSVTIHKKKYQNQLVALSPTPVSDGGAYQALIGIRHDPVQMERMSI